MYKKGVDIKQTEKQRTKKIRVYLGTAENAKVTYLGGFLFPLKETPRGPWKLSSLPLLEFSKEGENFPSEGSSA